MIDELILEFTLQNTDATTDWVASASVPFWFQRIEVLDGDKVIQTKRDLHLYLDNTIYLNDFERAKNLVNIGLDNSTYKANSTQCTIAHGGTNTATYRLKLRTFLDQCKIFVKGHNGLLHVKIYPQSVSTFSATSVTSLVLNTMYLMVKELELTPDGRRKMMEIHQKNVDYRVLDIVDEHTSLALTSGSTTSYITNNFHNVVYSHVLALFRTQNATTTNIEKFKQHNNVYFQDASGNNLSNGIQWSDTDLRYMVYQDHFPNTMTQQTDMYVYVPLIASKDPVDAKMNGTVNGYDVLPRNAKLSVNAGATATQDLDIICYMYRHIRVQNGQLLKF